MFHSSFFAIALALVTAPTTSQETCISIDVLTNPDCQALCIDNDSTTVFFQPLFTEENGTYFNDFICMCANGPGCEGKTEILREEDLDYCPDVGVSDCRNFEDRDTCNGFCKANPDIPDISQGFCRVDGGIIFCSCNVVGDFIPGCRPGRVEPGLDAENCTEVGVSNRDECSDYCGDESDGTWALDTTKIGPDYFLAFSCSCPPGMSCKGQVLIVDDEVPTCVEVGVTQCAGDENSCESYCTELGFVGSGVSCSGVNNNEGLECRCVTPGRDALVCTDRTDDSGATGPGVSSLGIFTALVNLVLFFFI